MDWISIWISISSITLLWILRRLVNSGSSKKLPPGPMGIPILGHFHLLGKNPHRDLQRLAEKYGPIIHLRLGMVPTVVVSSPAAAEAVLKTHDLVFAGRVRHEASKYLSYDGRNIVFAPYGSYWRNMRKLCTTELLSSSRINQFQAMRKAELGRLIGGLRSAAAAGESVDISGRVSSLNGDMICLMVFGRKFGDKELDERGFKAVVEETMAVAARPNLGDFFPVMGAVDLQGLRRRMKELSGAFDGFLERIIEEHKNKESSSKENQDFVDTMMAIMESGEAGFEFDRRHVKAVLLDMLLAGMDTSTTAIEWTLSELFKHPSIMQKLQEEIAQVVGLDQLVEESHLDRLDYLNLIIKESFRMHPAVPLLVHEPMEDCALNGFHVAKGSRLIVNVWSICRDPNVWQCPEKFTPERFVGSHIDLRGNDFELIPFGSGRRGCPGLQLGLTVVKLVVAQLVHCFDWKLEDDVLSMEEHFGLVVSREKPLRAIPTYRLHK
ncbi:cytochrome P450 71AU50-like [Andrographis paniculata]|uniref:cytochrome P450 71AU50-like n=1 Tax=Andrographis paniculata TaxID=175694 RepID=UPI0021E7E85F|nr:cytochrome P450 71AU50-like [Andrographis paniculata]